MPEGRRHLPDRLPAWARTIRVRLALTYSALLFGITALLLAGVYVACRRRHRRRSRWSPVTVEEGRPEAPASTIATKQGEQFEAADLASIQKAVNYSTLRDAAQLLDRSRWRCCSCQSRHRLVGRRTGAAARSGRSPRPRARSPPPTCPAGSRPPGPHDELRTLADTIDDMLERLEDAFAAQRHLVDDVSHELRNPVAVIRANVDAVLANERRPRPSSGARRPPSSPGPPAGWAGCSRTCWPPRASGSARLRGRARSTSPALAGEAAEEYRAGRRARRGLRLDLRLAPRPGRGTPTRRR